jgi:hypothetical protein
MKTASDVTAEIGEQCVVNQMREQYYVPNVTDVTDYPTVGNLRPIPDPTVQS